MTASPPTARIASPLRELPRLDAAVRALVLRAFAHIRHGELEIVEDGGTRHRFGSLKEFPVRAIVHVHRPTFYRAIAMGSLSGAFSYINGEWDCPDLVALVRVAARNLDTLDRLQAAVAPLLRPLHAGREWLRRNTRSRSRENIAQHYDIGNDLYSLMLDDTMSYSNGIFDAPGASLHDASLAKIDRLCRKLDLQASDHLVEIGTGWGALAVHAAQTFGCRVTTTTISEEQHALATERVRRAGVSGRVTVLLDDYRDLRGRFTKLVSVEMIEAIGWRYWNRFFKQCSRLLVDDGLAAIQAICQPQSTDRATRGQRTFINTHVFPGGHCPSVEALLDATALTGDLRLLNLEDITRHYPTTLAAWRSNLLRNAARLPARFDERFVRTWTLYLSLCEAAFTERRITDVQMVFAKSAFRDERLPSWSGSAVARPPLQVQTPAPQPAGVS
ncbi:MAG TPA: cyclopropane-fatty-acyl-phospholipid synthase family protein [Candidatus Dormibacteraeota bacterium]|nr:cyclopropane-fatty-acyl-phospholipid synthase family protein [Candidatus Dormibacteraeota bacterium]